MDMVQTAISLSKFLHRNQLYGNRPYFTAHIQSVANLATIFTYCPFLIAGCYLHDTLEDTDATEDLIRSIFGNRVADMVLAVTDGKGETRKERKAQSYERLKKSPDGRFIKLCDRITNIRASKNSPRHASIYLNESDVFKANLFVKDEHSCLWKVYDKEIENLRSLHSENFQSLLIENRESLK